MEDFLNKTNSSLLCREQLKSETHPSLAVKKESEEALGAPTVGGGTAVTSIGVSGELSASADCSTAAATFSTGGVDHALQEITCVKAGNIFPPLLFYLFMFFFFACQPLQSSMSEAELTLREEAACSSVAARLVSREVLDSAGFPAPENCCPWTESYQRLPLNSRLKVKIHL